MTMGGKSLVEWLKDCPKDKFPGQGATDYYLRYSAIAEYLNNNVHPHVNALAMVHDGGYLTDHGPDHIKTVIRRATGLVASDAFTLTPYEVYLFLVAAHLHDVGNCFGRKGHELKTEVIEERLGTLLGDDKVEQAAIRAIASAHGGSADVEGKDKDTIRRLPETEALLGEEIHPRMLAALLRFSDELADDRSRAARFALLSSQLPTTSEVYHKYAYALQSVLVRVPGDAVALHFEMTKEDACRTFGKGEAKVYLLDEIFERTLKMHQERMYCMRFLRPGVSIDKIGVTIKLYGPGYSGDPDVIQYRIEESGYPESSGQTIHLICPELQNDSRYGGEINGKSVHEHLSGGSPS